MALIELPTGAGVSARAGADRATLTLAVASGLIAAAAVGAVHLLSDPSHAWPMGALVGSPIGLLVLFAASSLISATLILPVPAIGITVAAALVADPLLVGIVAGTGQATGELTGYYVGFSGRGFLRDGRVTRLLSAWMQRFGVGTIFVLALVPNPFFDVAGMLAGALRMPVLRYLASASLGKVLRNVVIAYGVVGGAAWLI